MTRTHTCEIYCTIHIIPSLRLINKNGLFLCWHTKFKSRRTIFATHIGSFFSPVHNQHKIESQISGAHNFQHCGAFTFNQRHFIHSNPLEEC